MRWGKFWGPVCLVVCLLLCSHAWAVKCSDIVRQQLGELNGFPIYAMGVASVGININKAFPDYDPDQDMIFAFDEGLHASLYTGGWYWNHWGHSEQRNLTIHPNAKALQKGTFIRVRIGCEKVAAIVATISQNKTGLGHSASCHTNQLAFLQRHGVFLKGGVKLAGISTFREIVVGGFVDEKQQVLPTQEIISIANDLSGATGRVEYAAKNLHTYTNISFLHLAYPFRMEAQHLLTLIASKCQSVSCQQAWRTFQQNPDNPALDASVLSKIYAFTETLESSLVREGTQRLGVPEYQLLEYLSYQPAQIPVDGARELLEYLIEETHKAMHW